MIGNWWKKRKILGVLMALGILFIIGLLERVIYTVEKLIQ
jgi:hypothetical protein